MGLLDGLFGPKGSEDRLQAKMSLMGLTHRPNQQLMAQWSNDLANMRDERKATEKSNRTLEWMRTQAAQYPQLAPLLGAMETGGIDTGAAVNAAFQIIQEANKPRDPWEGTKVVGGDVLRMGASGPEVVYSDPDAGGGVTYGLTPQRYIMPDGSVRLGVLGNDGSFKEVALPEGASPAPVVQKVDIGDRFILMDQQGNKVGEEMKNLEAAAAATERGKAAGSAQATAASDIAAAETTLANIESLRNHPGRAMGTGASSVFGYIPGTKTREFQIEVERLKSGAFLMAIDQLRGMGALSNAEGQTATAAIAALDPTGTEAGFLKRLEEYETIVKRGLDRARSRLNAETSSPAQSPAQNPEPRVRLRYNPQTGALE